MIRDSDLNQHGVLPSQALIVTAGPFEGRICFNDGDEFISKSDFHASEINWFKNAGLDWETLSYTDDETGDLEQEVGAQCEIVTFGEYLLSKGTYLIPHQFLRPASMKDMIQRFDELRTEIMRASWNVDFVEDDELTSLFSELLYVSHEIRDRDTAVKYGKSGNLTLFLCHSSQDKPFVRTVQADLSSAGYKTWIDEFEIKVGDSIVDKIDQATSDADALLIFLSKTSVESAWVKREWQSSLNRFLSGSKTKILPVLIEDVSLPNIIADIKYADFRESYNKGIEELMGTLSDLKKGAET